MRENIIETLYKCVYATAVYIWLKDRRGTKAGRVRSKQTEVISIGRSNHLRWLGLTDAG